MEVMKLHCALILGAMLFGAGCQKAEPINPVPHEVGYVGEIVGDGPVYASAKKGDLANSIAKGGPMPLTLNPGDKVKVVTADVGMAEVESSSPMGDSNRGWISWTHLK
jgi:hypothetical protein